MEIFRPGIELTEQFPLTAIPTDTVRAVKNAGLIERIDYRPSREKELLAPPNRSTMPSATGPSAWRTTTACSTLLTSAALPMPRQALIQDAALSGATAPRSGA